MTVPLNSASLNSLSLVLDCFSSCKQWYVGDSSNSCHNEEQEICLRGPHLHCLWQTQRIFSGQHFSYLFRFHFSCCEVFNTVQKAGFCKFIVGSEKFLKLQTNQKFLYIDILYLGKMCCNTWTQGFFNLKWV